MNVENESPAPCRVESIEVDRAPYSKLVVFFSFSLMALSSITRLNSALSTGRHWSSFCTRPLMAVCSAVDSVSTRDVSGVEGLTWNAASSLTLPVFVNTLWTKFRAILVHQPLRKRHCRSAIELGVILQF